MRRAQWLTEAVAFASGALCATLIIVALMMFRSRLETETPVLEVPSGVLRELREQRAVIDNADDSISVREHDTILTQPDTELGFTLRPLVHLDGNVLAATGEMNLDPPVLYLLSGTSLSAAAQKWVGANSRMSFAYATDQWGRRRTVPVVDSGHKILIVGDSVTFGVGVNDEDTVASQLQQLLGTAKSVINAGVGGYDGKQAFQMAERLSRREKFATLVYIACENDFESADDVQPVLERFSTIAARFDGNVIVLLETYLRYHSRDVLLEQGLSKSDMQLTDQLRAGFPRETSALGFLYADWTDIVEEYRRSAGSIFSPFALYADHCHLSRVGAHLMATRIHALLKG